MHLTIMGGASVCALPPVRGARATSTAHVNWCVVRTPLFNACSNGQLDAVKHLLASGASTSSKSSKGRTALHVYVARTEQAVTWWSPGVLTWPHFDSLCHHSAASTGHTDTVLVLTGAGADVNAVDDGGQGACCELLPARRLTLPCV